MAQEPDVRTILRCRPDPPTRYRYLLQVRIAARGAHLAVLLKNPSKADGRRADPTVGKVEAWARRRGFGVVSYVNLFALRSPHPATLNAVEQAVAIGPDNDDAILTAARQADLLALGWGNPNGLDPARYQARIRHVLALLADAPGMPPLQRVGPLTRQGHPRHGLHWNGDCTPTPFLPDIDPADRRTSGRW